MEQRIGYNVGRLRNGAHVFILNAPVSIYDFESMGISAFPSHKLEGSPLSKNMDTEGIRKKDLSKFRRKRLIKVIPILSHTAALVKAKTEKFKSLKYEPGELKGINHESNPSLLSMYNYQWQIQQALYAQINDDLYPPSLHHPIPQWKLVNPVMARCVCTMDDYTLDVYRRMD